MTGSQRSKKSTTPSDKPTKRFTDEERGAMKDRLQELKAEAKKADAEEDVLAKIARRYPSVLQ